ncbi:MAG: 16S rRNA (uracil(1498)-N(3))-methyltransferase [Halioglobus sp.]
MLLFSAADQINEDTIEVKDERLTHLLSVHRAKMGDSVRVGELNGLMGAGEIVRIDQSGASITYNLDTAPPPKLPVRLVLALPRPKMLRRILRSVAEFGVPHLHLINSHRVEKSYWQTPVLKEAALQRYLLAGLEQARDTVMPSVSCHTLFKPFVEDELPHLAEGKKALVFHPGEAATDINNAAGEQELVLVIGPEGGFISYEVERLESIGCTQVSLGPRILRVENAVSAALAHYLAH